MASGSGRETGGDARMAPSVLLFGLLCVGLFAWLLTTRDAGPEQVDLSGLSRSTTHTRLAEAPSDPDPSAATDGLVVRLPRTTALYDVPDGTPFGKIGRRQFGRSWLPVIDEADGWVRVLLPSKPNGSTGWIPDEDLDRRVTPYVVRVHVGSRTLGLFRDGRRLGSWPVAVGAPGTPTPTGRTFVLGAMTDESQSFSPVILPLGFHSDTLDTYGGGPGTVALHGWPDDDVFGAAISHGCVRVPDDALDALSDVPLGTLVLIDDR